MDELKLLVDGASLKGFLDGTPTIDYMLAPLSG
jgi:hypothetical protein